jgi:(2Fe-2S) ferredoxin
MMEKPRYRAYICCGPNCGPKGSRLLLDALEEEVRRAGLQDQIAVLPTGCQNHCETGPTMVVYPGPVYYQGVDRERLRRIVSEHLALGRPVADYFWTGPNTRPEIKKSFIPLPELSARSVAKPPSPPARPKPRRREADVDDFKW